MTKVAIAVLVVAIDIAAFTVVGLMAVANRPSSKVKKYAKLKRDAIQKFLRENPGTDI